MPDRGTHEWTLQEEESRPFIKRALEVGINFFDTSNSYSDGTSEEILGRAIKDFAKRDEVVVAVQEVAKQRGVPMAQVALAWLLQKPGVTAPIVGASKPHHLEDAVAALSISLSSEEVLRPEGPYVPHDVAGFA